MYEGLIPAVCFMLMKEHVTQGHGVDSGAQ